MKNIIVLEDDQSLSKTLEGSLKNTATDVVAVNTLPSFYQAIENKDYDLCVMDRMIGTQDSIEAVAYVREITPQAKVLMLTKKASLADRIFGLETGADDYLPKPFSLAELKLRVKSLLALYRNPQEEAGIDLGLITFYPKQGLLQVRDRQIYLRKRENQILTCLARSLGTVVSRNKIISTLWPENYEPNPSTVDVYIRRLRQKLGEYGSIIQTRRGFGYRLVAYQRET